MKRLNCIAKPGDEVKVEGRPGRVSSVQWDDADRVLYFINTTDAKSLPRAEWFTGAQFDAAEAAA